MSKTCQTIIFTAAFAVMLAGLPGSAVAGRVNIDDFNGPELDTIVSFGPGEDNLNDLPDPVTQPYAGALGGFRKTEITSLAHTTSPTAASIALNISELEGDRYLSFSLGPGSTGSAVLTYDAGGATEGLGGANLLPGTIAPFFAFDVISIDQENGVTLKVGIQSVNDGFASSSTTISGAGTTRLSFASFGKDNNFFTNVSSVTLEIDGIISGVDLTLDNFYTADVPEPSTLALFGLGILGFHGVSRWRKRKTKSNG